MTEDTSGVETIPEASIQSKPSCEVPSCLFDHLSRTAWIKYLAQGCGFASTRQQAASGPESQFSFYMRKKLFCILVIRKYFVKFGLYSFHFLAPSKRGFDEALTNTVRVFWGLIKTSAWLLSPIAPLGDPWVASTSTLRLKWMFTSPNDYLSRCWVNASALSATEVTHTHTETRPQASALLEP